jgi:colanic acid/amylovoran biosynthesis glycosyltransferase
MELPVISTWHSGIPELVEDGVNGYLVAERDTEAYANAMFNITKWDLCPQNRFKIIAQFEKTKHAGLLIDIYNQTLKDSNKING